MAGVFVVLMAASAAAEDDAPSAFVRLLSDPPGASFKLGSIDSVVTMPADIVLKAGSYDVESSFQGYQSLTHQFQIGAGDTLLLRFVLLAERPARPRPEDLGLSYEAEIPLLLEEQADAVRRRFNAMAEVFAIVPLMQGVMAAVALGGGGDHFTGELMAAGIALSGGSYVLGKVMARRKLRSIREQNEVLKARNASAAERNRSIELQIRRAHADDVQRWRTTAKNRGVVEATQLTR